MIYVWSVVLVDQNILRDADDIVQHNKEELTEKPTDFRRDKWQRTES